MRTFALMRETVDYIIRFLLNGNDALAARVGYTADAALFCNYAVVVVPSRFWDEGVFGTMRSEPQLPLPEIDGVPLLFGEPRVEKAGGTLVVHADVVAGAFFMLSRYEEMLFPAERRDVHGRFLGRESLAARGGFLHRPIVDEYGALLRGWLREAGCPAVEPKRGLARIYLTHDVDAIDYYRHLRGFLGGIARNFRSPQRLRRVLGSLFAQNNDPAFVFPWMVAQDAKVAQAHKIYFIKSAVRQAKLDYPNYNLRGKDFRRLLALLQENGCEVGLHTSYFSGEKAAFVQPEKAKLEANLGFPITKNRWHYLRSLQPDDFRPLIDAGLTDDFTMGYADMAGFRLGTSRAVRWIDPTTREVTNLTLHPLTVMDGTLDRPCYMNLAENDAFDYVAQLAEQTRRHHGELVLLWHNTSFGGEGYHVRLYEKIIDFLKR